MADEYATLREVNLLRDDVRLLRSDVASVTTGATGVPVVQSQLIEVVKDVAELRADMNSRFDAHAKAHEQADRDRVTGRRWLIGTALVGIGAMSGLYVMILDLISRHH